MTDDKEKLDFRKDNFESWLYIVGKQLDRIGESVTTGILAQKARVLYLIVLCRRLFSKDEWKELWELASSTLADADQTSQNIYFAVANCVQAINQEWTFKDDEIESIVVPDGNSDQASEQLTVPA